MEDERQEPLSEKMEYTITDMLAAFRHGIEFESLNVKCDMDYSTVEEKHRPFFEWIKGIRDKEKIIEFEISNTLYVSFTIIFKPEDEVWTAVCEELGTATFGDTYEETKENIIEAINLHLDVLDEVGERVAFFKKHGIHLLRRAR